MPLSRASIGVSGNEARSRSNTQSAIASHGAIPAETFERHRIPRMDAPASPPALRYTVDVNWQTKPETSPLTIAQVSDVTGLSARTLRYYEELGLLPGVRRRAGGRRVYGADEIQRLRFIQRLK